MVNIGQMYQKGASLTEKRAKTENPYLNVHLINQYEFTSLISRKSFKRSKRSSDNELFLMKTSKGCNPAIRGHIKKWWTCISLFSKVYIFIKFHGSHLKI